LPDLAMPPPNTLGIVNKRGNGRGFHGQPDGASFLSKFWELLIYLEKTFLDSSPTHNDDLNGENYLSLTQNPNNSGQEKPVSNRSRP